MAKSPRGHINQDPLRLNSEHQPPASLRLPLFLLLRDLTDGPTRLSDHLRGNLRRRLQGVGQWLLEGQLGQPEISAMLVFSAEVEVGDAWREKQSRQVYVFKFRWRLDQTYLDVGQKTLIVSYRTFGICYSISVLGLRREDSADVKLSARLRALAATLIIFLFYSECSQHVSQCNIWFSDPKGC